MENMYNLNIERAVLSAIIFDPETYEEIAAKLKPHDFYLPFHQHVFAAMEELSTEEKPLDDEFLRSKLNTMGKFDEVAMLDLLSANPITNTAAYLQEIKVGKAILKDSGRMKEGLNIISCPTCGRIEADLVSAVAEVERRTAHIKTPMDVSVMGCVVNAIGEAKHADVAIAYGKGSGLVMLKGEVVARLPEEELVERFVQEVEKFAEDNK